MLASDSSKRTIFKLVAATGSVNVGKSGSEISIGETGSGHIAELEPNVSLSQLIAGLNALGVSPQEMADIIRSMKAAGAIHAELVIR